MSTDGDEIVNVLVRSIKFLAIGLAINAVPNLIPYHIMSSDFNNAITNVVWIVRAVGIVFFVAAARVAASVGIPSHG